MFVSPLHSPDLNPAHDLLNQAGYREGITVGKESALQEGFDAGFAQVGVHLGRELGQLRGRASALLSLLGATSAEDVTSGLLAEARDIAAKLAEVRFTDIAPRDIEAEQHAREHLETYGVEDEEMEVVAEELQAKRGMERLEDLLSGMSTGEDGERKANRPGVEDVRRLEGRLDALIGTLGLSV